MGVMNIFLNILGDIIMRIYRSFAGRFSIVGERYVPNMFLKFKKSLRYKIIARALQLAFIRKLGRALPSASLPLKIRQSITGMTFIRLKTDDFDISEEDVDKAHFLIAICVNDVKKETFFKTHS